MSQVDAISLENIVVTSGLEAGTQGLATMFGEQP